MNVHGSLIFNTPKPEITPKSLTGEWIDFSIPIQ